MVKKSTTKKLEALRRIVGTSSHDKVLYDYLNVQSMQDLNKSQNELFKDAVIVILYRKWLGFAPQSLMELGITTFDRRKINGGVDRYAGSHAENFFQHVWFMHLRLRGQAHLPQGDTAPDKFHFGHTVFVEPDESHALLHGIWHQPIDDTNPDLGYRPVIYISFADNDGLGKLRRDFEFIPEKIDTTIAVVDAQSVVSEARITRNQNASVEYLLKAFHITPYDVENTGNTAAYITIITILSVLRKDLYYDIKDNPKAKPGQYGQSNEKTADCVINDLMNKPTPAPPIGVEVYCSRCGGRDHFAGQCEEENIACTKCKAAFQFWRQENVDTHTERLCIFH